MSPVAAGFASAGHAVAPSRAADSPPAPNAVAPSWAAPAADADEVVRDGLLEPLPQPDASRRPMVSSNGDVFLSIGRRWHKRPEQFLNARGVCIPPRLWGARIAFTLESCGLDETLVRACSTFGSNK